MPIKPENRGRYPANWKEIRAEILKRAGNKCEFCGVENYAVRDGKRVVLAMTKNGAMWTPTRSGKTSA